MVNDHQCVTKYVDTTMQVAAIFTKEFPNKVKWQALCQQCGVLEQNEWTQEVVDLHSCVIDTADAERITKLIQIRDRLPKCFLDAGWRHALNTWLEVDDSCTPLLTSPFCFVEPSRM